jgi:hydrogenase-4 component B
MPLILIAIATFLAGGVLSLLVGKCPRLACVVGAAGMVIGCVPAVTAAVRSLASGATSEMQLFWQMPLGSARMVLDPLAAWFVLPIAVICALAAVYGGQYLQHYSARKNLGGSWFLFNLLAASMLLVVVAGNGVLFLMAWEMMSLASFFLVGFESEKSEVRRAAWTYLVAMHIGVAFLLVMFTLLGKDAGTLNFNRLASPPGMAGVIFVLAVIGFGAKAGFIPMHVWLPEAHPAAPSHVSAVMSGVMIKTGIYGLLRILTLLGPAPAWWGWTLLAIGVISGVFGVLCALAQRDLKRLLAYSSVENIGIITLAIGLGLLGVAYGRPVMAGLGFGGALLHVLNHSMFKSLLFLGAGSVLHSTGTRRIDRLGGLMKRMPATGTAFLVGAAAICGLPPLNGFVGEFLIYFAALVGLRNGTAASVASCGTLSVTAIGSLALIGGLAAACFTKAFGIVFLGEPRSDEAAASHECGFWMRASMAILALGCIAAGLAAPLWLTALQPAVNSIVPPAIRDSVAVGLNRGVIPLGYVSAGSCVLASLIVVLVLARWLILKGRTVGAAETWGCGYTAPTSRVQYTGSSFTWPLIFLFRLFVRPVEIICPPQGLFPAGAELRTGSPDVFQRYVYGPLFSGVAKLAVKLRWLQQGRIQLYVLYIGLTMLALLIWKLR